MQERPDLSEMKSNLMVNNARMKAELSLLEDTILQMLSASQGNILDDENLINTLAVSKVYNTGLAIATLARKKLHCNHRNSHHPSDNATHLAVAVDLFIVYIVTAVLCLACTEDTLEQSSYNMRRSAMQCNAVVQHSPLCAQAALR